MTSVVYIEAQSQNAGTVPADTEIATHPRAGDGASVQDVFIDPATVLPLPTGASTSALQTATNTLLGGTGGLKFVDEAGVLYGVKHVNNKPRVSSMPYLYDIAEGNVPGHDEFERLGYNADIDTAAEDIWSVGGAYVFPVAAQQMELVSTSVEDDPDKGGAVAGTGIHAVTVYYLDNTYAAKTEDVTLNGTGVVTTTAVNILRVNSIKAKTVGASGAAVGTIRIRNLADTPIYSTIEVGNTRSRNSIYTVPLGKTLYITSLFGGCGAAATTTATITLLIKYDHEADAIRTFFMPHAEVIVGSGSGGMYRPFEIPIYIPATVDIKCRATTTANNTAVSVGLRGWME